MRIDAHQHFWSLQRENDYGFLTPDTGVLYRDYLPEMILPLLNTHRMDATILVQAAPTLAESEWLLHLAMRTEFVAGVVGWLQFDQPEPAFHRDLERLRQHPKLVGLRPMLQDLPEDDWILRPSVLNNLAYAAEQNIAFDVLVYPRHLPSVAQMLDQVPNLRAVINHIAKPRIDFGELEPWSTWMTTIAQHPNVYCKLSGMVTEANPTAWTTSDFVPFIRHVVAAFGPDRLMFGSDWPVCLLAASYHEVVRLLEESLPDSFGEAERVKVFGENAARFYQINR